MDNLRIKKEEQYCFYFGEKGVEIFHETFPFSGDVSFRNEIDNYIMFLFHSSYKNKKEIDKELKRVEKQSAWSKAFILRRLDVVIRKVADYHGKTSTDWNNQIQILVNQQVALNFKEKYPIWESVISSAAAAEVIKVLYGIDTGIAADTLEDAANQLGISRQAVAEVRKKAIRSLDIAHGYIKKSVKKSSSPEDRERLAKALIAFRGDRTITEMASYFGVSLPIYWKLEKGDNKYITSKHQKIFSEALDNK